MPCRLHGSIEINIISIVFLNSYTICSSKRIRCVTGYAIPKQNITTNITLGNKNDVITISPFAISFPRTKIAKWLIVY